MSVSETKSMVSGEVADGFEGVREAFVQNLADAGDGGFSYAAYWQGRKVVDLRTVSDGWAADATPLWMSVTKAMTALCAQILWDRGLLDVEAPVASYWPEFAVAGKDRITVADVMTHRSGVVGAPALTELISLDDGSGIERTEDIVQILAAAEPVWEPGTQTGYHTVTYGWLVGEIIRRIDGRSLGTFFREEVAEPLGVPDVTIGVPESRHGRIPTILPNMWPEAMPGVLREYMENLLALARDPDKPAGISCLARDGVGALDRIPELFNNVPGRVAELGGSNLAGSASDVAKIFAAIAEGEIVSPRSVDFFSTVRNEDVDVVLLMPIARALGYWRNKNLGRPQAMGPNDEAFGHTGAGGQIGFCDPKARVGAAFVRSHYTVYPIVYFLLNAALYEAIATSG